jgi:hypothetical protein
MEKLKSFWAASTTNKVIVVAVAAGVVYGGYKLYKKYGK